MFSRIVKLSLCVAIAIFYLFGGYIVAADTGKTGNLLAEPKILAAMNQLAEHLQNSQYRTLDEYARGAQVYQEIQKVLHSAKANGDRREVSVVNTIEEMLLRESRNFLEPAKDNRTALSSAAELTFDPSSYDFGEASIGDKAKDTFVVTNTGTGAVTFQDGYPRVGGLTGSEAFSLTNTDCEFGLEPEESCSIEVTFAPEISGNPELRSGCESMSQ